MFRSVAGKKASTPRLKPVPILKPASSTFADVDAVMNKYERGKFHSLVNRKKYEINLCIVAGLDVISRGGAIQDLQICSGLRKLGFNMRKLPRSVELSDGEGGVMYLDTKNALALQAYIRKVGLKALNATAALRTATCAETGLRCAIRIYNEAEANDQTELKLNAMIKSTTPYKVGHQLGTSRRFHEQILWVSTCLRGGGGGGGGGGDKALILLFPRPSVPLQTELPNRAR